MTKKVLLVSPLEDFLINPKAFPPLGILYLSSYLKDKLKINVDVLHGNPENINQHYDLIGISATTPQYPKAKKFLSYIKENELAKKVVLGGPHTTSLKCAIEAIQDGFDHVVRGQGEKALVSLLIDNNLPKIINGTNLDKSEIDNLIPDRDTLNMEEYGYPLEGKRAMTIITSRGCPYRCSFCTINSGTVILRSPEKVLEEIDYLKRRYNCDSILFVDDSFTFNKKRLEIILDNIHDIRYRCYARTDNSFDRNLLKKMVDSGCIEIGVGIESGSQEILELINKKTKVEENLEFIRMAETLGLKVNAFVMIGLPNERKETINQTREFMIKAKPSRFGYNIFTPFPDSEIVMNYEVPFKSGRFKGKRFKDFITLYPMPYELAVTKAKIIDSCFVSTPWLTKEEIVQIYHEEFQNFIEITGFNPRNR